MHSLPEAARLLGLAPATLRHQARHGRLAAGKLGREWFVSEAEVARYRRVSLGKPGQNRAPRPIQIMPQSIIDEEGDAA